MEEVTPSPSSLLQPTYYCNCCCESLGQSADCPRSIATKEPFISPQLYADKLVATPELGPQPILLGCSPLQAVQQTILHLRLPLGPEDFFSLLFSASLASSSRCSVSRALRRARDGSSSAYRSPARAKASLRSSWRGASTRKGKKNRLEKTVGMEELGRRCCSRMLFLASLVHFEVPFYCTSSTRALAFFAAIRVWLLFVTWS